MAKPKKRFDTTRASRDGHEFHEAWVARKCLGLLFPENDFVGIAIEGFGEGDQDDVDAQANEIADAVLYFGPQATLEEAHSVIVVQVKYSKAAEFEPFRASDAKKTVGKFATAYRTCKRHHGVAVARGKLRFELVTNRPILPELIEAIQGLAAGHTLHGLAEAQAAQIRTSCKLIGKDLKEFARQLWFTGLTGDLRENKHQLAISLADWSPARDSMATTRLHAVRQLARDKAGLYQQDRNIIRRADVLTALDLQDDNDLLPCPECFPDVGEVVERDQLEDTLVQIPLLQRPLLVHADGGVGKTVFMNSIAARLAPEHEVVLFDCFGMGQYRVPGDARHLPERGLVHLANDLACRGLCDPLLPTLTSNSDDIIRAFRSRLSQAVETGRRAQADRQLVLLLDAIDNAGEQARDRGQDSFPKLLLESFCYGERIDGIQVVVSSRTHRRRIAVGSVPCEELALRAFTPSESALYLSQRLSNPSEVTLQVAYSRSRGNARVLEHLVTDGQELLEPSEADKVIELDELLQRRITSALFEAQRRGYPDKEIKTFLAGLATLPPPVPVADLALANKIAEGAINSFAADLAPLLEQSKHGLMFRDEPTETLLRREYAADIAQLRKLANNLDAIQDKSIYAATTLPDLLLQLNDGEHLVQLAFDERLPATISSAVGRQAIRRSRLRAAIVHATRSLNYDHLVRLLTEMSTLAAIDQRGTKYLLDFPSLTVASRDVASLRRIFEVRTNWQGTRHARLAITHALNGEIADAYRHGSRLNEWIAHYFEQDDEYRREHGGPKALDVAAIPFTLLVKGNVDGAQNALKRWKDWFAYEVARELFSLVRFGGVESAALRKFMIAHQPGLLAAAIRYADGDDGLQRLLVDLLAQACSDRPGGVAPEDDGYRTHVFPIIPAILQASAVAVTLGMDAQAMTILAAVSVRTPSLHTFMTGYWSDEVGLYLVRQVLVSIASGRAVHERDLLPIELQDLIPLIAPNLSGQEFRRLLKEEFGKRHEARLKEEPERYQHESKSSAERFIDERLKIWLEIASSFAQALRGQAEGEAPSMITLLNQWISLRGKPNYSTGGAEAQDQYDAVGQRLLTFVLGANHSINALEVKQYVDALCAKPFRVLNLLEIVSVLGTRPAYHALAGIVAIQAKKVIELEDEVDHRGNQLATLALAIAPASLDEAVAYFRQGLEQMDAIGSGDYQFAGELMQFARELHGQPLSETDSHTFSNICELNLGEERKFHWGLYGAAMANISGLKGLAKLARWEDRDRISFDYTLLPYVYALVDADKLDPSLALTLLRLSNPAELYVCGTEQFAKLLESRSKVHRGKWATVLIDQYLRDNPGFFSSSTLRALTNLAQHSIEDSSQEQSYLCEIAARNEATQTAYYELKNWREPLTSVRSTDWEDTKEAAQTQAKSLAAQAAPTDEVAVSAALNSMERRMPGVRLDSVFLEVLRQRVAFKDWPSYLKMLAGLEALDLYSKIRELQACKEAWSTASQAVVSAFAECATLVVRTSALEFIEFDRLSLARLNDLSALSGVGIQTLVMELVREFAHPSASIPAAVWLSLAAEFNRQAAPGIGQQALTRLLNSGSAKLANSAVDGTWQSGLYPADEPVAVTAGLIWFTLGSPTASRRWMAAHSLRTAVALGRPDILDQVFAQFNWTHAGAFQAQELPFFYLHARLWLLIAIARIAQDHPHVVAKHRALLENILYDTTDRHVLFKHFAAEALRTCALHGQFVQDEASAKALNAVNVSPFKELISKRYGHDSFYQSRPEKYPPPAHEVHLDYDFDKHEVSGLTDLFGRERWETLDAIGAWVHMHDPNILYMSDLGGRYDHRRGRGGHGDEQHSYGEYLCWHALHVVAGDFLAKYPIVRRPYDEDSSWVYWLNYRVLSHPKGYWLADGTDRRPVETLINARDPGGMGGGLTSTPEKLLAMIDIGASIGEFMTVTADWQSLDGINIHVMSALAPSSSSAEMAIALAAEDPFQVYLPYLEADDEVERSAMRDRAPLEPWVVVQNGEARLDATDVLGVAGASRRSRLGSSANQFGRLASTDPFNSTWCDPLGQVVLQSQVWGCVSEARESSRSSGARLQCRTSFIRDYLSEKRAHLLLLLILRRYESGSGGSSSKFWHTTAVVRITESLGFDLYLGRANELHQSKF